MGLFNYIFKRKSEKRSDATGNRSSLLDNSFFESRLPPMLISTVYRCVDLISDALAVLPLITYVIDEQGFKTEHKKHPAHFLLELEPNENMSSYTFFKLLVSSTLLTGNGYALIVRDKNMRVEELRFVKSETVTIEWKKDKDGIDRKRYRVFGEKELVEPKDMIHILNFSYDGVTGVSTLEHARNTMQIASNSENHARNFFSGGGALSGILKYLGGARLDKKQKDDIYSTWADRTSSHRGGTNNVMLLEGNFDYSPISISPKDSQLLESRQFNVIDICRFFSVSPVKAFDLTKSNYATVEATQLQFLTDTVLPWISKVEEEINRKVFLKREMGVIKAEFETSAILRTDKTAQAAYTKELFYCGAMTPNEVRRSLNLPKIEKGDTVFIPVNLQPIDKAFLTKEELKPNQNE